MMPMVSIIMRLVPAFAPAIAQPAQPEQPAVPARSAAALSNDRLAADGVLHGPTVYKINNSHYFKIRGLAGASGGEKQDEVSSDTI